ncbi:MAG TPA: hypothetical protein PKH94_11565 [Bacteroidales bacterium]|nr:hypothetical protein [Bacteroidales bacterium]HNS47868.1 hypothetical protein [Bacteroidales bacterium]
MKTLQPFLLAMFMMTGMFVLAGQEHLQLSLNEEAYIDDIPFNTEEIAGISVNASDLTQFSLKEEEYIDDIPFDTEEIVQSLQRNASQDEAMASVFLLDEELYIDDIPFETEQVVLGVARINDFPGTDSTRSTLSPLKTIEDPVAGILEIVLPVIIILGTLSYAVYEFILN